MLALRAPGGVDLEIGNALSLLAFLLGLFVDLAQLFDRGDVFWRLLRLLPRLALVSLLDVVEPALRRALQPISITSI